MNKPTITQLAGVTGLAVLAASLMVGSTHAALITFAAPVSAYNTSVLDIPWLAGGTFVQGVTYGSGPKSFTTPGGQNISLAGNNANLGNATMPAGTPSGSSGWYNGGAQWNYGSDYANYAVNATTDWRDAMYGNLYHNNASDATSPLTLHLAGLVIGQAYDISLFSTDTRFTDRYQAYWSSYSSGVFSGGTSGSFSQNSSLMVLGTFTADAAYQDIFIQSIVSANADSTLSAYTLYAVPEPGTCGALAGVFCVLVAGFRRRRKQ